jgi:hypothetical protein
MGPRAAVDALWRLSFGSVVRFGLAFHERCVHDGGGVLAQSLGAQPGKVREARVEFLLGLRVDDQGVLGCRASSVVREVEDRCKSTPRVPGQCLLEWPMHSEDGVEDCNVGVLVVKCHLATLCGRGESTGQTCASSRDAGSAWGKVLQASSVPCRTGSEDNGVKVPLAASEGAGLSRRARSAGTEGCPVFGLPMVSRESIRRRPLPPST